MVITVDLQLAAVFMPIGLAVATAVITGYVTAKVTAARQDAFEKGVTERLGVLNTSVSRAHTRIDELIVKHSGGQHGTA